MICLRLDGLSFIPLSFEFSIGGIFEIPQRVKMTRKGLISILAPKLNKNEIKDFGTKIQKGFLAENSN